MDISHSNHEGQKSGCIRYWIHSKGLLMLTVGVEGT